jgi:hypothetical protein
MTRRRFRETTKRMSYNLLVPYMRRRALAHDEVYGVREGRAVTMLDRLIVDVSQALGLAVR